MGGILFFDIVVIGASSAGLYAAEILAKNGKTVVVMEQSESIAPEARTYIITPGLLRVMPDFNPDLIQHEINQIVIQAGSEQAVIPLSTPDLILDRNKFILDLTMRARKAGAEILTGSKFLGFDVNQEKTHLLFSNRGEEEQICTQYLIGADGVNSQVRNHFQIENIPAVPLLQAEIKLPKNWDVGVTQVWFNVTDTPYFYWLIPDQNRTAVVGLVAEPGADIRSLLDNFLNEHNFQPTNYQSGLAALHSRKSISNALIGDLPVLFVGDAAGQVKVSTVGGTVTGLWGGKAAAEAILNGSSYRKALLEVQRELNLHLLIRTMLEKMSDYDYERLVQLITPSVQSLLSRHDRDGMRSHFWKLPFLQPGLIPLGLKLLLT